MSRGRKQFHPKMVPEVAKGYYWDCSDATGLGTTAFKIPEGNGVSSFNLIQATVASQPDKLSENGFAQFRMRNVANANPSRLNPAAAVRAGWTGPTYVAGWFRIPDASGDITGLGSSLFIHSTAAGNQLRIPRIGMNAGTPDIFTSNGNSLGTPGSLAAVANSPFDGEWKWVETAYDFNLVLGGSSPADIIKQFSNFSELARTSSPATPLTALFDATAVLSLCCFASQANGDTTDFGGIIIYANGIPNIKNRKRLANLKNPLGIHFSV